MGKKNNSINKCNQPKVVTIILHWEAYEDTARCIESLNNLYYKNHDVLVVDNGSTDQSGQRIENEYPDVEVVFNDQNIGFSGGNNSGIAEALDRDAEYVWLLNNDTIVSEGNVLGKIVNIMENNDGIGICSPLIKEYESDSYWFVKGRINKRWGFSKHIDAEYENGELIDNDYIPFCCSLFRSDVFKNVGLLPEEYFLYYEDVHYCILLSNDGYQLKTDPSVEMLHESTSSGAGATRFYYFSRNKLLLKKRFDDYFGTLYYVAYFWWFLTRFASRLLKKKYEPAKAILEGFKDALLGDFGKGPYP